MILYLAACAAILYAGYAGLGKILPVLLLWYCKRKNLPELTIGSINVLSLSFFNIKIIRDGVILHIDKIKVASSFFSRDITRPVHIIIYDVRIEKDAADAAKSNSGRRRSKQPFSKLPHPAGPVENCDTSPLGAIEVPPRVFSMVQFVGIEIFNGDVFLREAGSILMATVEHASLYGTLLTPKSGNVTLSMSSLTFRLMSRNSNHDSTDSCLAQVKVNIHAETQFSSSSGLRFSDVKCNVEKPEVTVLDPQAVVNASLKPTSPKLSSKKASNWKRWLSTLPSNLEFDVRDVCGRVTESNSFSVNKFILKWVNFASITEAATEVHEDDRFSAFMELHLLNVETGNREKIFGVDYMSYKLQNAPHAIDLDLSANTCWLCFDPQSVSKAMEWLLVCFKRRSRPEDEEETAPASPRTPFYTPERRGNRQEPGSWLKLLENTSKLTVNLDFREVRGILRPQASRYAETFGCSQIRLNVQCKGSSTMGSLPKVFSDVGGEFLVEEVTSSLVKLEACSRDGNATSSSTKYHAWGNVLGMGVGMVTLTFVDRALTVQAVLERCQLEWSDDLRDFLLDCVYPLTSSSPVALKAADKPAVDLAGFDFQVNCKHLDVFLLSEGGFCLAHRVDQVIFDVGRTQHLLRLHGTRIVSLFESDMEQVPLMESHAAMESTTTLFGTQDVESLLKINENRKLVINAAETVEFRWESRFHLAYRHVYLSLESLKSSLRERFPARRAANEKKPRAEDGRPIVAVEFNGRISLDAVLSPDHVFELRTGRLEAKNEWNNPKKGLFIRTDSLTIGFDKYPEIFTITQFEVASLPVLGDWSELRAGWEELTQTENRAWKWSIGSFSYKLPYGYNFARSFNEELMAVRKWIRKVHGLSSAPFKPGGGLPADTLINIGTFRFELSDDPFEIKLRENYSLLEDEAKERPKREDALLREVKKRFPNQLIPEDYIKELSKKLEKKDADVYIQRCRLMRKEACPTQLFTWIMTDVSIVALADPSYHGKSNVMRVMHELDSCSPIPAENEIDFSILWCRAVQITCEKWTFRLRDYPQPLLVINQFHAWGKLAGAEQAPTWRATRLSKVYVAHPWSSTEVERGMMPLKFFHGLEFDINYLQLAYGPCWEPALAQFNLSMENVFAPSLDPSPPLPFWDKIRIKYHGSLLACFKKMTLLLHASLDPYNTTEEMALHWSNLLLDWNNAKFTFVGELEVSVRTASKYDDCRLLHLPRAKLVIKLGWKCSLGNADDHYSVSPCSPQRLPEYSSNMRHDSYRAFRSDNLDLNVSLDTRPLKGDALKSSGAASVLFFASTCRWFENLKFILSGVSRPIRKGKLFNNLRPRKTPLSRHYKRVSFSVSLDRIRVSYWMSAARQKGMQLCGGPLTLSSTHLLTLVPIDDGLRHRPSASWSILAMTCSLFDSEIWLMSALSPEDTPAPPTTSSEKDREEFKRSEDGGDGISVSQLSLFSSYQSAPSAASALPSPTMSTTSVPSAIDLSSPSIASTASIATMSTTTPISPSPSASSLPRVEKRFFVSLSRTEYVRETPIPRQRALLDSSGVHVGVGVVEGGPNDGRDVAGNPVHKLVVDNLRGAWTTWNKDVVMSLVDGWHKAQALRKNLSRDVFKTFNIPGQEVSTNATTPGTSNPPGSTVCSPPPPHLSNAAPAATPSSSGASGQAAGSAATNSASKLRGLIDPTPDPTMLRKLIEDLDNAVAVCEDIELDASEEPLHGQIACTTDDVVSLKWNIELVNSQVLLRGCESHGYIIVCASKAQIRQREHRPVWRDKCLVSKTTWIGTFDGLQYYATVSARHSSKVSDILWLSKENIDDRDATVIADLPDLPEMVGSGHSVGGVVSTVVGTSAVEAEDGNVDIELQRIVSRCKCEFFWVFYGDVSLEPGELKQVPPPPPPDLDIWNSNHEPFDALTLKHHDLHVSTNPLQYAMILDIVNNLVLQAQPRKKELDERLQTLRFETQLHSVDDQRKPILELQNQVRGLVMKLRHLEREIYVAQRELEKSIEAYNLGFVDAAGSDDKLLERMKSLNQQAGEVKEKLYSQSEELNLKLSVYNECQIAAHNAIRRRYQMSQGWGSGAMFRHASPSRSHELCFTQAQWRLTEADGQIGITDLVLRNFLYKKVTKTDESVEHLAELGYISVKNLIPSDVYTDVLRLTEIQPNMPMPRRQRAIRVFCRDKPPVGGIPIKEHFEINLAPVNIALTQQFYKTLMKFMYPEKIDGGEDDDPSAEERGKIRNKKTTRGKSSKSKASTAFYVDMEANDVEKMKRRAEQNKMFVYVKMTELPVRLSYKGDNKLYNCEDLRVTIPPMEAHNMAWTWRDFLMAMKDHGKSLVVTQFLRQKIKPRGLVAIGSTANLSSATTGAGNESNSGENGSENNFSSVEEEKIRKIMGDWMQPEAAKPQKKGFFHRK